MRKLIQILFVSLLMAGLSATEAFGQANRVKPRKKPPTTTTTPTKPIKTQPAKKPATSTKETITVNGVSFVMVRVDGGTFVMGPPANFDGWVRDEDKAAHQVKLSTFSIGETEVTQELWTAVMSDNPSEFKGAKRPVDNVNWKDCQEFIKKLNQLTGRSFRLPTEAEWEFAARGGNKSVGYKKPGSDNENDVAWYEFNSGAKTHDVGMKAANELGLYDMAGNVAEWCNDWYGPYSSESQTNPRGPSSSSDAKRVIRGGGWNTMKSPNVWERYCWWHGSRDSYTGFRLAM